MFCAHRRRRSISSSPQDAPLRAIADDQCHTLFVDCGPCDRDAWQRRELRFDLRHDGGRGLDLALLAAMNRAATGGLAPDLTLIASRELPRRLPYNSFVVVPDGHRLPELTTAWLPDGADDVKHLLNKS